MERREEEERRGEIFRLAGLCRHLAKTLPFVNSIATSSHAVAGAAYQAHL